MNLERLCFQISSRNERLAKNEGNSIGGAMFFLRLIGPGDLKEYLTGVMRLSSSSRLLRGLGRVPEMNDLLNKIKINFNLIY